MLVSWCRAILYATPTPTPDKTTRHQHDTDTDTPALIFRIPAVQKSAPSRSLYSLSVEACSVERYEIGRFNWHVIRSGDYHSTSTLENSPLLSSQRRFNRHRRFSMHVTARAFCKFAHRRKKKSKQTWDFAFLLTE